MNSVILELPQESAYSHSSRIVQRQIPIQSTDNHRISSPEILISSLTLDPCSLQSETQPTSSSTGLEYESNLASHISADAQLWHRRLGHLNFPYLAQLSKQDVGIPLTPAPNKAKHCDQCAAGKSTRTKIPKTTTSILDLIHSDLCGPLPVESLSRSLYYVSFTDDYSRKTWIYFMSGKDQTFSKFRIFKAMIENQAKTKIRALRTDGEFNAFCQQAGIHRQLTAAYTPFQNGLAERRNRSILEKARSMMFGSGVPNFLWLKPQRQPFIY
jgi:hypothetical protein